MTYISHRKFSFWGYAIGPRTNNLNFNIKYSKLARIQKVTKPSDIFPIAELLHWLYFAIHGLPYPTISSKENEVPLACKCFLQDWFWICISICQPRFLSGKSMTMPQYMFVGIKRKDADDDLPSMIKYAFNFAFYKFGIEITMIAMVILIGSRVDFVSLVYANIWLGLLFHTSRETKRRIWPIFQWFIVLLIVAQYMIVVDMPPFSCSCKLKKIYPLTLKKIVSFYLIIFRVQPESIGD